MKEREAQPQQFSSIPASMWWGVATLTTVGYGDVYPVTTAGRVLGAGIAILGVGLFALPTGILASAFSEELQKRRRREAAPCPHCGRDLQPDAVQDVALAVEGVEIADLKHVPSPYTLPSPAGSSTLSRTAPPPGSRRASAP